MINAKLTDPIFKLSLLRNESIFISFVFGDIYSATPKGDLKNSQNDDYNKQISIFLLNGIDL